MKTSFKSTKELLGAYIENRWNSMSSIFKVTKATPKTVELTEVDWDIIGSEDPVTKIAKISFDKDGNPVFRHVRNSALAGEPKIRTVKKQVKFDNDGYILQLSDVDWSGYGTMLVAALNDDEAKKYTFTQYWG